MTKTNGLNIASITTAYAASEPVKADIYHSSPVQINLELKLTDDAVTLIVDTYNGSDHSIYASPDREPFWVTETTSNLDLPEMGSTGRSFPPLWEEYIEIPSGSTYTENIKLNEKYGFLYGCYAYQLDFNKGYYYPNMDHFHNLGEESFTFSWRNPIDPFHGRWYSTEARQQDDCP